MQILVVHNSTMVTLGTAFAVSALAIMLQIGQTYSYLKIRKFYADFNRTARQTAYKSDTVEQIFKRLNNSTL